MKVVRPQVLAGIDLVGAPAQELGAEPVADPGLSDPEALVLHLVAALDGEDVGDLHPRKTRRLGRAPSAQFDRASRSGEKSLEIERADARTRTGDPFVPAHSSP
jgi:hypothetical protein